MSFPTVATSVNGGFTTASLQPPTSTPKFESPPPLASSISPSSSSSSPSLSSVSIPDLSASGVICKPKRPLSAYNLFFKHSRDEILATTASAGTTAYDHSKHATTLQSPSARRDLSKKGRPPPHRKIGFAEMARQIGAKWKALEDDRRKHFESLAKIDKQRYLREMEIWKAAGGGKVLQKDKGAASTGGSLSSGTKAAASQTTKKSPATSPTSKKSRKKSKADASKVPAIVATQSVQHDICAHKDYVPGLIGFAHHYAQDSAMDYPGAGALSQQADRAYSSHYAHPIWHPTTTDSSSSGGEAAIPYSGSKWDFANADRILDALDEEDFWNAANPTGC